MLSPARLLGFAFTNADFLFETDTEGKILFAVGAAKDLVKESGEALVGKSADKLFQPSEGAKFVAFAKALKTGPADRFPDGPCLARRVPGGRREGRRF